ncbi:hypothetical protein BRADI_5g01466v3 [Brachypodium distachyon]|uniref:Uncharacterized protein n=1 Tax=Brachypodium distachyon TaxID=15368 RepID=A0A2K2CEU9_BRADI|nr:hypothetical protein BRADI_5g01466v3 [Brachypodium distachyon]
MRTAPSAAASALASNRQLIRRWAVRLLLSWLCSAPLLANLSASAAFFRILGGAPISVAVPVTNATTFAVRRRRRCRCRRAPCPRRLGLHLLEGSPVCSMD